MELGFSVRRHVPEVLTVRSHYLALDLFNFISSAVSFCAAFYSFVDYIKIEFFGLVLSHSCTVFS